MKQLMLDYWRRKSLLLLFGAIMEFIIGMLAAVHYDNHNHPLAPIQIQLGIFLGPFLLSFDLQRGHARTVCALPLTARQIARAWWFATVGIPAAVFSALMYAGAATICLCKPNAIIDWPWLAVASVILFFWMGSTFTMIFVVGYGLGSGWRRAFNILAGALWGIMIGGGMWLLGLISESPLRIGCVLTLGAALTAVGWFRAEQLVMGRAAFRPGSQTGGKRSGQVRLQNGYGAVPYLMITTITRAFLFGVGMMLIMGLIFFLQGGSHYDWTGAVKALLAMGFFPFWFLTFVSLMPAFMQLRLLRSLPISPTGLAAILIGMTVLPLLMLGTAIAALIATALGIQSALTFTGTFLLTIPMSALCVVFVVRLGNSTLASLLMIFLVIGIQGMSAFFTFYQRIPLTGVAAIASTFVLFCFLLVRLSLLRSSKPYRMQPNLFGTQTWWQTR